MDKPIKTIGELEEQFGVMDTPENRMEILREINRRKGKIASDLASTLCQEQLTVNEAISILKSAEHIIMHSRFAI
jgi:hypothetical protein